MNGANKNENTEIDLRDYFKLIYKNKRLVLSILFIFIAVAIVRNIFSSEIYEVNAWLEIGKTTENTVLTLIESPAQISKKIKNNIYGNFAYNAVISNPEQTDLISIEIKSSEPDKAKKDLEKICETILAGQNEKVKTKRDLLKNEIKSLEDDIALLKQKNRDLETRIELANAYSRINLLKNYLSDIYDTRVVKAADVSGGPAKPNSLKNIILAGMIGLFLGISIVFWKKWRENK